MLAQRLRATGGVTWAPIGGGFALPHPSARIALGRDSGTLALLLLRDVMQVPGNDRDGALITRLFFFIAPSPRAHLDLLGRLSRLLARGPLRDLLTKGAKDEEIFAAISGADKLATNGSNPEVKS
jgi:PTS system nitrogen regulatory IIA component